MKLKLAVAAAALTVCGSALADTTSVFSLVNGNFADEYFFSLAGPSTLVGDTNSAGVSWTGVTLSAPSIPFSATDTNPDDGFSFAGLQAGDYVLTFSGAGTGGYGGYVTTAAVPEPGTWAMLLAGLGGLGLMASRRR